MVRILFVCMGNICRSPTAEGVFRHYVMRHGLQEHIHIDSAGTHGYHIGCEPDHRTQAAAKLRGFDLSSLRARRISGSDFEEFDYILTMDRVNYEEVLRKSPPQHRHKVQLFLSYAEGVREEEVPDPYYGGNKGFEHVLDLVEAGAAGLLEKLIQLHRLQKAG
ncbi:MAG TPA: low molecular weight protein-tyrosine-phosphatase [Gammaproteobacteria bacterium]|nr:low molecular weight protein-tyrosine-phosphatase [Gammaproteobacteria bacterium]